MNELPWINKYRPTKLKYIMEQNEIIKVMENTKKTGELPHMLLHGPPGTGKTTTILALCYELFGPKIIGDRVIELNASDDRGINIVRDKIITFAKTTIGSVDKNYPCPPYKIVILDEADAMTVDAQAALRQVIESTSKITRFCFICNYIDKITEPIISRCIKFRFKSIKPESLLSRLKIIARHENIKIEPEALKLIATIADGDGRRAIMILQYAKYINNDNRDVVCKDIEYITGMVNNKTMDKIWNNITTKSIYLINNTALEIINNAHPLPNILIKLKMYTLESKIDDKIKAQIMFEIGNTEARLLEGANEYLQILNLIAFISSSFNNYD